MTFDCTDARAQARFWATALDYEESPPPQGWTSWEDWLRDNDVPEAEWNDGAAIRDPEGVRPAISFLKVPEPKTAKNRIHIDLQVSGGPHLDQAVREQAIRAKTDQLLALGATVLTEAMGPRGLDHYVLADPEGNEFCVI
ncbi:glyoxalase [Enemella evansiae]|nr:glyoxalase [Enemella evansiae]